MKQLYDDFHGDELYSTIVGGSGPRGGGERRAAEQVPHPGVGNNYRSSIASGPCVAAW
jgi:hypothetical protein